RRGPQPGSGGTIPGCSRSDTTGNPILPAAPPVDRSPVGNAEVAVPCGTGGSLSSSGVFAASGARPRLISPAPEIPGYGSLVYDPFINLR
ncbi:hypothetical protein, partial [Bradyrhizobium sp.]|uniref:hypothetical protein n=1 Tax=Bradyrhizobium sp. TaxID=376 RepID=UPI003C6F8A81